MKLYETIVLIGIFLILAEVTFLIIKFSQKNLRAGNRSILVDTSVLMDGRITEVASTGFIGGILVVPRTVIRELQLLADNSNHDKRTRARYGLDVVTRLQDMDNMMVEILQDSLKVDEGVDNRLLSLAKKNNFAICTLDYNLAKVAVVEGVEVLNLNELSQSLRMNCLPGEIITVNITQKGQDSHQGVGYLTDGTMVVVEQSSSYIGKEVKVEVIRNLQTISGRMVFAKRTNTRNLNKTLSQKAKSNNRSK